MITIPIKAKAFLIFANDIDPAHRNAYESWHGQHHVPQRLTVPGILSATRYRGVSACAQEYLTLYGLADVDVLSSPAYRQLVEYPDAVTLAMRPHLRRSERLACRLVKAVGIERGGSVMVFRSLLAPDMLADTCAAQSDTRESVWNLLGQTDSKAGGHPLTQGFPMETEAVLVLGYSKNTDLAEHTFQDLSRLLPAVRISGPYAEIDR